MNRECILRIGFFFGIFVIIALWETLAARRKLGAPKAKRWMSNLGIISLNTLVVYRLLPLTAIGLAALSRERNWGLLNNFHLSVVPALILGVMAMDLARIPQGLDGALRLFVVTPDMHRVHHSILVRETNSNFGFNLPWWDRLFGTYSSRPAAGHEGMTIGISEFRDRRSWSLPWMLALPFIGEAEIYPFAGRTGPGEPP